MGTLVALQHPNPKTKHMLVIRGIWFTGMDLWPACYSRVSKRCRRLLLHDSLYSLFTFTSLIEDFLKPEEKIHTHWVFFWEASKEPNQTAVQQTHRQLMIINLTLSVVRVKTVFPFCFLSGMREQVQGHTRDPAKVQGMEDRTLWDV